MDILLSCKFNIDTACVELRYADGEILSIDCIAVEDEFGYSPHARVELDWLIYNDPLSYAQMVLGGTSPTRADSQSGYGNIVPLVCPDIAVKPFHGSWRLPEKPPYRKAEYPQASGQRLLHDAEYLLRGV